MRWVAPALCSKENKLRAAPQIIDDFAAYNGEGFMSTLELLPMWQDVDPDVDLFGSGAISELSGDASEWQAGHALSLDGPSAPLVATLACVP